MSTLSGNQSQIDPTANTSGYTTEDAKQQAAGLAEAAKNSEV